MTKIHKHFSFCCIQKSSQSDFLIPFVSAVAGDAQQTAQPTASRLPLTHAAVTVIQTQFLLLPTAENSTRLLVYVPHISNHFSSSHLCRSLAVSAGSREPRRQKPAAPVGVETICLQQDEPRRSDSEPLSAACPGSLGEKHPTVLFNSLVYVVQQFQ